MAEAEQATTPRALWLVVVVPPLIAAVEMEMNYVLVRQACSAQRNLALYLVTLVALALTVTAAIFSFATWKRAGSIWPGEANDVATCVRFVSVLGILNSAMSFLLILAQGIAMILFDPCQW